jgi:hypothetical protein
MKGNKNNPSKASKIKQYKPFASDRSIDIVQIILDTVVRDVNREILKIEKKHKQQEKLIKYAKIRE